MSFWVYKVNSKGADYQSGIGDWEDVFSSKEETSWGNTGFIRTPHFKDVKPGDILICHQTDRNEFVGICQCVRWENRKENGGAIRELWIKPIRRVGVKVRPLKKYPEIDRIDAFKGGKIQSVYFISDEDAQNFLKRAGAWPLPVMKALGSEKVSSPAPDTDRTKGSKGGGFSSNPEEKSAVELKAMEIATDYWSSAGSKVTDVSSKKVGYDLTVILNKKEYHIEVKGSQKSSDQFIITDNEYRSWQKDKAYCVTWVRDVFGKNPKLDNFLHSHIKHFKFKPIQYMAKLKN